MLSCRDAPPRTAPGTTFAGGPFAPDLPEVAEPLEALVRSRVGARRAHARDRGLPSTHGVESAERGTSFEPSSDAREAHQHPSHQTREAESRVAVTVARELPRLRPSRLEQAYTLTSALERRGPEQRSSSAPASDLFPAIQGVLRGRWGIVPHPLNRPWMLASPHHAVSTES